jgi:hypothetical protein
MNAKAIEAAVQAADAADRKLVQSRADLVQAQIRLRTARANLGAAVQAWAAAHPPVTRESLVREMGQADRDRQRRINAGEIEPPAAPRRAKSYIDRSAGRDESAAGFVRANMRNGGHRRGALPASFKGAKLPSQR